jgi:hypothetical protein
VYLAEPEPVELEPAAKRIQPAKQNHPQELKEQPMMVN